MSLDSRIAREVTLHDSSGDSLKEEVDRLNAEALDFQNVDGARSKELALQALTLARSTNEKDFPYEQGVAESLCTLGCVAEASGDLSTAMAYQIECSAVLDRLDCPEIQIRSLRNLAWVYFNLGEFGQSIEFFMRAIKTAHEENLPDVEVSISIPMSSVYAENGDLEQAIALLQRAVTYLAGTENLWDYCVAQNNLAMAFLDRQLYEDALEHALHSVEIVRQMEVSNLLLTVLDTVGQVYLAKGEYDRAEVYFKEVISANPDAQYNVVESWLNLARARIGQGYLDEALQILLNSLEQIEQRGQNRFSFLLHELLSQVYEMKGMIGDAIFHFKRFHEIKSRILNENTQRQVTNQAVLYQAESARLDAEINRLRNLALRQEVSEHRKAVEEMNVLATTDELTRLFNRRHFMTLAGYAFDSARQKNAPMCTLMIDIDHFKRVNDEYGHLAGDRVLTEISAVMGSSLRLEDLLGRYGGEEFAVFLTNTGLSGAKKVAERILSRVREHETLVDGNRIGVTLSIGVAQAQPEDTSLDVLLEHADHALLAAKRSGRDGLKTFRGLK
jgi:diguanylate cyclase (GGDEF)-like protein